MAPTVRPTFCKHFRLLCCKRKASIRALSAVSYSGLRWTSKTWPVNGSEADLPQAASCCVKRSNVRSSTTLPEGNRTGRAIISQVKLSKNSSGTSKLSSEVTGSSFGASTVSSRTLGAGRSLIMSNHFCSTERAESGSELYATYPKTCTLFNAGTEVPEVFKMRRRRVRTPFNIPLIRLVNTCFAKSLPDVDLHWSVCRLLVKWKPFFSASQKYLPTKRNVPWLNGS